MIRKWAYLILVAGLLHGCSWNLFSAHTPDIQQGNALDEARIEQLRIGMTQRQVRFLLGEPVHRNPFRGERSWDYVFYFQPGRGSGEQRRLSVIFEDGRVKEIKRFGQEG